MAIKGTYAAPTSTVTAVTSTEIALANKIYELERKVAALTSDLVEGDDINTEIVMQDMER